MINNMTRDLVNAGVVVGLLTGISFAAFAAPEAIEAKPKAAVTETATSSKALQQSPGLAVLDSVSLTDYASDLMTKDAKLAAEINKAVKGITPEDIKNNTIDAQAAFAKATLILTKSVYPEGSGNSRLNLDPEAREGLADLENLSRDQLKKLMLEPSMNKVITKLAEELSDPSIPLDRRLPRAIADGTTESPDEVKASVRALIKNIKDTCY